MISGSHAYLCSLIGERVLTLASAGAPDWTDEALKSRKWGVRGKIIQYHTGHSYVYEIKHDDGTFGYYEPGELNLL